jgi:hypothetical protein
MYSSTYVDGNKMLPYKEEFTRQSRTDAGKNAQLIVYFESKKGECIIKWYNELKCSTALELSSIMGAVNSWQNNMDVVYGYYKDVIMGASSLNEKAELIERCHMAANFVRKFKSSNYEGVKLKDLDPNCQRLAKWRGRHSKMLNWA